jgi:hypothetical protein
MNNLLCPWEKSPLLWKTLLGFGNSDNVLKSMKMCHSLCDTWKRREADWRDESTRSKHTDVPTQKYKACSKKDLTFAIKALLLILQHFKHCSVQSSPLYWRYTVPNVSSIVGTLPGTHFLWWHAVLLSHFPESLLWFGNDVLSKWFGE